jgi:hypothetical protein
VANDSKGCLIHGQHQDHGKRYADFNRQYTLFIEKVLMSVKFFESLTEYAYISVLFTSAQILSGGEMYHIEPIDGTADGEHRAYKQSDTLLPPSGCGMFTFLCYYYKVAKHTCKSKYIIDRLTCTAENFSTYI